MPFTSIPVTNGSTPVNATWGNNAQVQYTEAVLSLAQYLLTPFVLSGLVATKDGTTATQLDVTAGVALLQQPVDSSGQATNRWRAPVASTQLTSTPSTTYNLYLQPDGTWYWSTANAPAANSLYVATVTTDASSNILVVTDKRPLNTTLLSTAAGTVSLTSGRLSADAGQITSDGSGNLTVGGQLNVSTAVGGVRANLHTDTGVHALVIGPPAAGATAYGIVAQYWNGTAINNFFSLGAQLASAPSYLDVGGNLTLAGIIAGMAGGGTLRGIQRFTGSGAGTYTHGLSTTPGSVQMCDNVLNSTTTMGVDSAGASTVHVNQANAGAFYGLAYVG